MRYYFKKGKNATEMPKKLVQCMEKVLWLIERVKSGLWSFVLEISCWTMLHGWVDQLKLVVIYLIETLIENNKHYTMWEIANILKISKSIKLVVKIKNYLLFNGKKPHRLFGHQYVWGGRKHITVNQPRGVLECIPLRMGGTTVYSIL